jgi:hypothetical protein
VAIAKTRNLAAIQMNLPSPVVDQNKIVSRAIHFRETQHDDDCSGGFLLVMSTEVETSLIGYRRELEIPRLRSE